MVSGLPSSVVPRPSRASPRPDGYRALMEMSYWVPGCRFFRRAAVLSPFTEISFLGPLLAEGLYAKRYWSTFPGAGSQETFMEDTVSSKTLRSRGEPLAEKVRNKKIEMKILAVFLWVFVSTVIYWSWHDKFALFRNVENKKSTGFMRKLIVLLYNSDIRCLEVFIFREQLFNNCKYKQTWELSK